MTVCKFWQQGNCKFGDKCKFEHPGSSSGRRQDAPRNPFAPLTQNQGFAGRSQRPQAYDDRQNGGRQQRPDSRNLPFHLDVRVLREDLTSELPLWPLSAYGPGRDAPRQLMEGEIEQSPEEMRTLFYLAKLQNNTQAALQDEQARAVNAQGQISAILNDLDGACRYIMEGEKQRPNRWDVCAEGTNVSRGHGRSQQRYPNFRSARGNPFDLPQQARDSNTPGGAAPQNPFGRPPPAVNPFGPPAPVNPFNKVPPSQPSAFGQPSMPGVQNPFGQPPAAKPINPFGQPPSSSNQQPQNPFGQPPPASNQPAQNPFGQQPQTNGFGGTQKPINPFGQPPQPSNPFPPQQPSSLGSPSPFQQAPTNRTVSPFGAPATDSNTSNPMTRQGLFGAQPRQQPSAPQANGFSASAPTTGRPARAPGGQGVFAQAPDRYVDTEASPEEYGPEGSEKRRALQETYQRVIQTGRFDGDVPEEPPLHEWRDYDF